MKKIFKIFILIIGAVLLSSKGFANSDLKLKAHLAYFKHPSQEKILSQFCSRSLKSRRDYLINLLNIVKNHPSYQKAVDYNVEEERLKKHKTSLDIRAYQPESNRGMESAFELGIIYAFSDCGYRNDRWAIDILQKAFKKPDTYFVIAEIYRLQGDIKKHKKIMFFYNNSITLGNQRAYYNKALYLYELFLAKNELNISLQDVMNAFQEAAQYDVIEDSHSIAAALNDFAILKINFYLTEMSKEKITKMAYYAFKLAAEKNFKPAAYNFLLLNMNERCEKKNTLLFKNYAKKLQNYSPAQKLMLYIKKNPCGKTNTSKRLIDTHTSFHKKKVFVVAMKTKMMKEQAFEQYNSYLDRGTHF